MNLLKKFLSIIFIISCNYNLFSGYCPRPGLSSTQPQRSSIQQRSYGQQSRALPLRSYPLAKGYSSQSTLLKGSQGQPSIQRAPISYFSKFFGRTKEAEPAPARKPEKDIKEIQRPTTIAPLLESFEKTGKIDLSQVKNEASSQDISDVMLFELVNYLNALKKDTEAESLKLEQKGDSYLLDKIFSQPESLSEILEIVPNIKGKALHREGSYIRSFLEMLTTKYPEVFFESLKSVNNTDLLNEVLPRYIVYANLYEVPAFKNYIAENPMRAIAATKELYNDRLYNKKSDTDFFLDLAKNFPLIELAMDYDKERNSDYQMTSSLIEFINKVLTQKLTTGQAVTFMMNNKTIQPQDKIYPVNRINHHIVKNGTPQEVSTYLQQNPAFATDSLIILDPAIVLKTLHEHGYDLKNKQWMGHSLRFWVERLNKKGDESNEKRKKIDFLTTIGSSPETGIDPQKKIQLKVLEEGPSYRYSFIEDSGRLGQKSMPTDPKYGKFTQIEQVYPPFISLQQNPLQKFE